MSSFSPAYSDLIPRIQVHLGQKRGTEVSRDAIVRVLGTVYHDCRRELLASHYWAFAEDLAVLTAMDERPPFGFSFYHRLPPDFVSLTYINNTAVKLQGIDGAHQILTRGRLATSFTPVYMSYTTNVQDESLFSPVFRSALAYKLAATMCFEITSDKDLQTDLYMKSETMKFESIVVDYRDQGSRETVISSDLADIRSGAVGTALDQGSSVDRAVQVPTSPLPGFEA